MAVSLLHALETLAKRAVHEPNCLFALTNDEGKVDYPKLTD